MGKRAGSRISPDDYRDICRLARSKVEPADIHRAIEMRVSPPTIRAIWKELNPPDDSGMWSLADAESREDVLRLLSTQRALRKWSNGRIRGLTRKEAAMIIRIYWAMPNLNTIGAWATARDYIRAEAAGEPLYELDIELAYVGAMKEWQHAVDSGWVDKRSQANWASDFHDATDGRFSHGAPADKKGSTK